MKRAKKPIFNLDEKEQALSDALDRGEFKTVKNFTKKNKKLREAASNYLKKEARINIRLSVSDLERIKEIAAYEGLPYQTLIGSILHKYSAGHLEIIRE